MTVLVLTFSRVCLIWNLLFNLTFRALTIFIDKKPPKITLAVQNVSQADSWFLISNLPAPSMEPDARLNIAETKHQ